MTPRVSICIPAYNAGVFLRATLDSVWQQDYDDYEVVVVDDGSTDETHRILAADGDRRLRIFRHERNRGQAATVTETIARARGEYVKFLDADDLLLSGCVSRMAQALDGHPAAAFVFSHRNVLIESDDLDSQRWLEEGPALLPSKFGDIAEVNDGHHLIALYAHGGFSGNWIAEPAGVMARRSALLAVGGYSRRVRLATDMEMWLRLMTQGDVVFIDEPLYAYRFAFTGMTGDAGWPDLLLEQVWAAHGLLENLGREDAQTADIVRAARNKHLRRVARVAIKSAARREEGTLQVLAGLASYFGYRAASLVGSGPSLHVPLSEAVSLD